MAFARVLHLLWALLVVLLLQHDFVHAKDYYDILQVPRGASDSQIKRAYRKLALQYHPDKVSGSEAEKQAAAKRFADINNAYEVLSNEEKRQIYDRYGEEGVRQMAGESGGGGGGGMGGGGLFDFFFGGGGGPFGGGQGEEEEQVRKGHDVVVDLAATLEQLYTGAELRAVRDKAVLRPASGKRKCKCRQKMVTRQLGPGMYQQYTQQVCDECPAVKLEREQEEIALHLERGAADGHVITFFEEGEPLVDGEPGDLRFVVRAARHARFARRGDDLLLNVTIPLVDALTGFEREVPHLDGHAVKLASSGVVRPGDMHTIKGEGMPVFGRDGRFGDLYVTYTVDFPAALSEAQKATARELLGAAA